METREPTREELIEANRELRERLWEAEETLRAIQSGEVDALVIQKPDGEHLYTLTGADRGYRVLVESITEGALILSSDDSIYYCNRTLGEMLGLPIQQIIGRKFDPCFAGESRPGLLELVKESRAAGIAKGEFLVKRNNGTLLPVNVSLNSLCVEDFHGVCAVITDLSEQKKIEEELRRHRTELECLVEERTADLQQEIGERRRMEDALRESEARRKVAEAVEVERQRLLDVLETLPVMVCLLAPDYHVVFANLSFREKFGESRGRHCYEYRFGRSEPCDFCESFSVLKTGQPHHWEIAIPDGGVIDVHDFPFTNADGSPLVLEMDIDITDRRRAEAELKTTIAKLEQLNQELQEFAFIASHDLQEPLRKMQTFGDMLVKKHKDSLSAEGQDYMERIIKGAGRMSELLRALLGYSRSGTSQLNYHPVPLTEIAKEAASDLERLISKAEGSVEIGELPTVEGDPPLLRQLFQNIIENAIKYRKESTAPVVRIHGDVTGTSCRVFIEDNGIGFDESYCERIFKPFQRLHGRNVPYSGTGMGLAICRKIVARHAGSITASSEPGRGTTLIVTLPLRQDGSA